MLADAEQVLNFAARQLAAIEDRFKHSAGFGGQGAEADLLLSPQKDASAQPIGLHQPLHEFDLIDAGSEETVRELDERVLA